MIGFHRNHQRCNKIVTLLSALLLAATVVRSENMIIMDPDSIVDQGYGEPGVKTPMTKAAFHLDIDDLVSMPSITFSRMDLFQDDNDDDNDKHEWDGSTMPKKRNVSSPVVFRKVSAGRRRHDKHQDDGSVCWHGISEGQEEGFASIIRFANGDLVGSVSVDDTTYTINTMPDGSTVIKANKFADLPQEEDDANGDEKRNLRGGNAHKKVMDLPPPPPPLMSSAVLAEKVELFDESGQDERKLQQMPIIDVLVVVTNRAMCEDAGLSTGCSASSSNVRSIEQDLALRETETNNAMQAIGVNAGIRIVKIHHDTTGFNGNADRDSLDALRGRGGSLAYVHDLREEVGADIVALITGGTGCGIGELPGEWSVTNYKCLGYYTFTHELGHNFGCYHNRADSNNGHSYAHGIQHPGHWRTVMSYDCEDVGCRRIPFFSNDVYTYQGRSMGDAQNNNARIISERAAGMAALRDPPATTTPPGRLLTFRSREVSDHCFDLRGADPSNGSRIWLYPCNGSPAQQWYHDDKNRLRSAVDSNKCVIGVRGSVENSADLIVWDCPSNDDKRYVFDRYTDGTIRSRVDNGQCVDVSYAETIDGQRIVHWQGCHGGDNQKWFW